MYKQVYLVKLSAVMTARFWLLLALCMATASCGKDKGKEDDDEPEGDYLTSVENVEINGVTWATCNVAAPGTFAAKPEAPGKFYQWNRKIGWAATGAVTGWNDYMAPGETWIKDNDPSPAGWRVPTFDEFAKLRDGDKVSREWTTLNGVSGMKFTDKATQKSIFLCAAGNRVFANGSLEYAGQRGSYWASTSDLSTRADLLEFTTRADWAFEYRNAGCSVRPVKE